MEGLWTIWLHYRGIKVSLDSGPFYLLRYVIFRDTPLFAIAQEIAIHRGLRYPSIVILRYNAISRSVANTGYREEYRNE